MTPQPATGASGGGAGRARTGAASSTLQDGRISHCNPLARELGVRIGEPGSALVHRLLGQGGGA